MTASGRASVALAMIAALAVAACDADHGFDPGSPESVAPPLPLRPPGIVVVLIDTLRRDHVGAYGEIPGLTPELDRLAARSWLFEDALATSSWTKPSVASLFTGRYPASLGVQGREDAMPESVATLAGTLSAAGFQTLAVATNSNASRAFGFDAGFDRWKRAPHTPGTKTRSAPSVNATAFQLLDNRDRSRPFFLYLHNRRDC